MRKDTLKRELQRQILSPPGSAESLPESRSRPAAGTYQAIASFSNEPDFFGHAIRVGETPRGKPRKLAEKPPFSPLETGPFGIHAESEFL